MKKLILMALLCASPAAADVRVELCETMGQIAAAIMQQRQENQPMSVLMARLVAAEDGPIRDATIDLVKKAYSGSAYGSREVQERVIANFRNEAEAACFAEVM